MGVAWRLFGNPALRLIDSEKAHTISIRALRSIGESGTGQSFLNTLYKAPELPIEVFGSLFHHPLGLAAGFDKGAEALLAWSAMGFSWSEYGGVTRYPQEGNPKPRMFRANKHRALVNKMGFNNPGASDIRKRLSERKAGGKWPKTPVAANIGRSKNVPNEHAGDDYASTIDLLWDHADMFVLNISSPNTPGLRDLQGNEYLEAILKSCNSIRSRKGHQKPYLLKLSPDTIDEKIRNTVSIAQRFGIDGFVATNTTIKRPVPLSTQSRKAFSSEGGLSGRPLHSRSLEVINSVYDETNGKIPIVGVGGIDSKESAWEAITSGASLLQLYSALVFNGPTIVSTIVKGLKKRVRESGFSSISEAVGYKHI
ncbi:MAG: quinone-dependent dihydroorotate dehydrogenase [Candidatus Thermoplasmatota archaeon]|nr:quinone-dependent dihydroorotate dehydrogenase [Candidatus Thermoplasmatota archaeon]MED5231203.1 quinone-dependent dihydroorotate dehydrogenase [Candidatus Thermoplasmatota archaeon]